MVGITSKGNNMASISEFWDDLSTGSAELLPNDGEVVGSAAIDGLLGLPAYILETLSGGAELFGS